MEENSPSELSPSNSKVDLSADVLSAVENLKDLSKISIVNYCSCQPNIVMYNYNRQTRKLVPITGRASLFLVFLEFSKTK